jgi:hypothetical protein
MTGQWDHFNERCNDASSIFPGYRCPEEELGSTERKIDRIRLRDLLRLCFEGPRMQKAKQLSKTVWYRAHLFTGYRKLDPVSLLINFGY